MSCKFFPLAVLVVLSLSFSQTQAAFIAGYTTGASSQLLESNNAGAGGEVLFIDGATTGGSDFRADDGQIGWVSELAGIWDIGDDVTITGLAIPIWANSTADDATNNTQNDTWTITWYQLSGGANLNQYDGSSEGEASFATSSVEFASAGTGVDEFYVILDTPVAFTATSTGIAFNIKSDNNGAMRLKQGNVLTTGRRNGSNGDSQASWSTSLAGTVTAAIPEPTSLLLLFSGMLVTTGWCRRKRPAC